MVSASYINRNGLPVFPQPVDCRGMNMHVFGLMLESTVPLQQFCDDQFNTPMQQPGRFKLLAPLVTLTFTRIAAVSSASPGFSDLGTLSENEATLWVPVVDTDRSSDGPPLMVAVPYMFVDNVLALAAGREIFGFPKDPAAVIIPDNPATDVFAVDADTVATFGNGVHLQPMRIIEVAPAAVPGAPGATPPMDGRAVFEEMVKIVEGLVRNLGDPWVDLHLAMQMLAEIGRPELETLLLKQMRDLADGLKACYQAVVRSPLQISSVPSFNVLGAHVVTLTSTDSHPLISSLGLGSASLRQISLPVLFAFNLQFDAVLPNGFVLWNAAGVSPS